MKARQMADEQAKAWAEAEQRAKAQAVAQAKPEQTAPSPAKPVQAKTLQPVTLARRKPFPFGKIFTSLFFLLLILIVTLPYVWPLQSFVPAVEKKLSAQFNSRCISHT
ncbi:MAG: hypothetical protein WDM70_02700 [Nitrosomonadales bacterium]